MLRQQVRTESKNTSQN